MSSRISVYRVPTMCSGSNGHGFHSCWGLRFFFVPCVGHVDQFTFHLLTLFLRNFSFSYSSCHGVQSLLIINNIHRLCTACVHPFCVFMSTFSTHSTFTGTLISASYLTASQTLPDGATLSLVAIWTTGSFMPHSWDLSFTVLVTTFPTLSPCLRWQHWNLRALPCMANISSSFLRLFCRMQNRS